MRKPLGIVLGATALVATGWYIHGSRDTSFLSFGSAKPITNAQTAPDVSNPFKGGTVRSTPPSQNSTPPQTATGDAGAPSTQSISATSPSGIWLGLTTDQVQKAMGTPDIIGPPNAKGIIVWGYNHGECSLNFYQGFLEEIDLFQTGQFTDIINFAKPYMPQDSKYMGGSNDTDSSGNLYVNEIWNSGLVGQSLPKNFFTGAQIGDYDVELSPRSNAYLIMIKPVSNS